MSGFEVRPFQPADLRACGALLAQRHRDHRGRQPLLSARYEDPAAAAAEIETAVAAEHASGAVALRRGAIVGYLLGAPKAAPTWGPNVWVEAAGQATVEAELMRDLYAFAATSWVDEGRTAHYVILPAGEPELVDAWFRLGFGLQHIHGLRPTPHTPPRSSPSVLVRRAGRDDVAALARASRELALHQGLAPTYSAAQPETPEESIAAWRDYVDDPDYVTFVAQRDDMVVGAAVGCSIEKSSSHTGPARPDNAFFLGFASVFPQGRGSGVGRALAEAVFAIAATRGFDSVVIDWRATNLLASRTWPRLGFAESFLRLHRLVGY
jgi:ribosomal protein S18 acetylase RimI-like enzyme